MTPNPWSSIENKVKFRTVTILQFIKLTQYKPLRYSVCIIFSIWSYFNKVLLLFYIENPDMKNKEAISQKIYQKGASLTAETINVWFLSYWYTLTKINIRVKYNISANQYSIQTLALCKVNINSNSTLIYLTACKK